MAGGSVSNVYVHVIEDVISKVREEFINSGAGENVLGELQTLWEMKSMQCGAIPRAIERSSLPKPSGPITPVHDLNVPYEGPIEEYETPTAEMLFPPTPLQTPIHTPLPGTVDQSMYNIPTGPSDYAPVNDVRNGIDLKVGRSSPYMQPPSPWMNQRPLGVDVNVAYVEGREETDRGSSQQPMTQDFFMMSSGKRKRDDYTSQLTSGGYLPQQDGSGDMTIEFIVPEKGQLLSRCGRATAVTERISTEGTRTSAAIPQRDGVHDDYDDLFHFQGVANEEYSAPTPAEHVELLAPMPSVGTPNPAKGEALDDDEPSLNEDDDDDDDLDDLGQGEEEPNTQHLLLAQFEKVTRTKSRWKCTLKDGIMHLNKGDILFNKATGEFEF